MKSPKTADSNSPKLTEAQIASIYPTAKTYDEMREKRRLHEASLPKVSPSRFILLTSVRTYVVVAFFVTLILLSPNIIVGNIFANVFFGFFLALVWLGSAWWQLSELSRQFFLAGINLTAFVVSYCIVAGLLIAATFALMWHLSAIGTLGVATILHTVICYILMKLLLRSRNA